jgi:hypothetical protein
MLGPSYPGAAVLADAVTNVPAAPILQPPNPISQTVDQTGGCIVDPTVSTPKECVFGDTTSSVLTVALIGDSLAGEWFDALNAIAVQRHWKLVVEVHSGCPWTSTLMLNWNGIGELTACQAWGAAVLHDLITTIRPNVVITSDYPSLISTPRHPVNASPAAMAEIGAGMAQYWMRLEAAGISVTPIRETPDLVEDVPTCVDEHLTDLARCDVPVSKAIGPDSPVTDAAKLMNGTVTVVNANPLICGPKVCAPVVGNVLVYDDSHHLTGPYSKSTAPFLESLLLQANKALAAKP